MQSIANKNCILIVDDDFINRELLKNIFTGFTFEEAEDGKAGLKAIKQHKDKLSAIILDVQMPKMSGIDVLKKISKEGITEEIPVFLITAQDDDKIVSEAYALGVVDVVSKPISAVVIQRRVKTVIELYSAREALGATVKGQKEKLEENAKEIDELHRGTIEALATAIEFRDIESGQHVSRIYGMTKYILAKTPFGEGLLDDEIESIARGAIMHDVGKIAISDIILNKPGKLTREEFEIMKQHTTKGAELLSEICQTQLHSSYRYAMDIARHHHERWDGRGYPDGLAGDEISVAAQVVSIVDVYDALVSVRVYKKAYEPERAVEMIKGGECGVFNPKLVECFLLAEPAIRKWYTGEEPDEELSEVTEDTKRLNSLYNTASTMVSKASSHTVLDVMLLMTAVQNANDVIASVNLTKNTYHIIGTPHFITDTVLEEGCYDELVEAGYNSVSPAHRKDFSAAFGRENLIKAYREGKKSVSLEYQQYSEGGELHWIFMEALLMEDSHTGDVIQISLLRFVDSEVAEREKTRKILTDALQLAEQANSAKYDFLSKMSHDIRTPLNAIIGMTTIIAANLGNKEKINDCLTKIGTSSKYLLGIVNDILDYTKIESGSLILHNSDFNIRDMVAEITAEAQPLAESKGQTLSVSVDERVANSYIGDEFRVRQVLAGLLDNAHRYTPEGGTYSLSVTVGHHSLDHDVINFKVEDNGIGISDEFLPNIFEPFSQGKGADTVHTMGLGLSIARNLAHLMNGDLGVKSKLGCGSVFSFELPMERGSLTDITEAIDTDINVLVVDDDAAVCEQTQILLNNMGISAEIAESGKRAVELVRNTMNTEDEFDVAIVDWQMPEMDGIETVRRIRQIAGKDVLVVVMSAYDWSDIENEARSVGVDLFIAKPISATNLRTAIACTEKIRREMQNIVFNGERVLLVEDNDFNAEVAKAILEMKNIKVDVATNGKEAYEIFTSAPEGSYLAVLMDILMPVMDGHEATRAIRASSHPEASSIPIFAMTANAFHNDIFEAKLAGMNGHISKPVDFDELSRILFDIVKHKQMVRFSIGGGVQQWRNIQS